ncbi:unnamed protein product [Rotaria magnacalcarata]|uniref:Cation-transporting P-type ATPase N-terminal domain-containing protein n=1 Tax=Rotaria magnacalcarata TaxID=392030 RepID=A0A815NGK4_9BILA|nr:unnamed protein product [Rotaria magnacalcarata]CAF1681864.1 unnamed protein product [Rotaria magnacalcarata]CAF2096161.1 unnamed protein product [Rotaria magnacalcarata]
MDNKGVEIEERDIPQITTIDIGLRTNERHDSIVDLWATVDRSRLEQDVHIIPLDDLYQRFHTNPRNGLSAASVINAQVQYGANKTTPPKQPSYLRLFINELFIGFNAILWIASVLTFLSYKPFGEPNPSITNLALAVVLILVVVFNSMLNVYQEIKSIKIVASFSKLSPTIVTVRRDGEEQEIFSEQIVPGDIILIRIGDKLPADCRFLICDELKISISELTGKLKPVTPTVHCTSENFMKSTNIGFSSSIVEQGTGEALVIATGDNTVLGKMTRLLRDKSSNGVTGLHREVNRFVLFICVATIVSIIILWITWAAWLNPDHHEFISYNSNIVNSIGMTVAFLPLGLPSTVTIVLTFVAKKMYRQRIIVKSLRIVETFNSISVIATDKTGILTQNKMTVTHLLWDTHGSYKVPTPEPETVPQETLLQTIRRVSSGMLSSVRRLSNDVISIGRRFSSGSLHVPQRMPSFTDDNEKNQIPNVASEVQIQAFRDLLLGACLCNNAENKIVRDPQLGQDISKMKSELRLVGDAADTALYNLCVDRCHVDLDAVRKLNPRLKVLPFNSSNKFMVSANQIESSDPSVLESERTVLIIMKGAPDIVIQRCLSYKTNNDEILPLNADMKQALFHRHEELGKNGYRVIAMCQQSLTRQKYDRMMERYKEEHRSQSLADVEDLNGFPLNDYCFIGLFALLDPPRPEVLDATFKARRAQIRVAMVTGDHPTMAKAIAKQVHILTPEISEMNGLDTFKIEKDVNGQMVINMYRNEQLLNQYVSDQVTSLDPNKKNDQSSINADEAQSEPKLSWYKRAWASCRNQISEPKSNLPKATKMEYIPYGIVVAGTDIDFMDDFLWDWVLSHQELVFARISPEQKLRIVSEFQRRAEIVAVTGTRAKDVPALKCAHLGIAIESGAEVSKEAGDMILLDNNFASIIQAIENGRLLNDNLKKVSIYLLPGGSWSQIWPVFFNLWFGMPLALSALWATVFCMLNDVVMSLAVVTEMPERDIMSRPPSTHGKDHLLDIKLLNHAYFFVGNLECFTAFFCFCYYWIDNGVPLKSFLFTYENFGLNGTTPYTMDQLQSMNNVAQSVYYCSMCLFQFFNFFATRTRYASIFQHNPFWGNGQNLYIFGAMLISIAIQLFFTQIGWFNRTLGTGRVPAKYVMPTLGFGMLWLIIDELRKLCIRKYPRGFVARIAW